MEGERVIIGMIMMDQACINKDEENIGKNGTHIIVYEL